MHAAALFLPALLACLVAGGAAGQGVDSPAAPDVTGGGNVDPATGLALGTPVDEVDGLGSTYIAEVYGAWEVRCLRTGDSRFDPCQMYQLLTDADGNPVAEFNLFDVPDANGVVAGATIVTPLDTLLLWQMRMRVDDGPERQYPFSFCRMIGCFVQIALSQGDITAFRAGNQAIISIVPLPAPDQVVDIGASLSGFTAAYADLVQRTAATIGEPAGSE
ncbi:MAG: invasion associated locus B family protein [Rhodobacteraceae bacterium]|nr:invasion associated locus B family protein [Paracoccaceae bacterium]